MRHSMYELLDALGPHDGIRVRCERSNNSAFLSVGTCLEGMSHGQAFIAPGKFLPACGSSAMRSQQLPFSIPPLATAEIAQTCCYVQQRESPGSSLRLRAFHQPD
jgi:hypothetical protein